MLIFLKFIYEKININPIYDRDLYFYIRSKRHQG